MEDSHLTVELSLHLQTGVLAGQERSFPGRFKVKRRKSICSFKNNSVQGREEAIIQWDILKLFTVCVTVPGSKYTTFFMPHMKQEAFSPVENNTNK